MTPITLDFILDQPLSRLLFRSNNVITEIKSIDDLRKFQAQQKQIEGN